MRWHTLVIRWCVYLRHQSGKAYKTKTIRQSGCLSLPSQRTLRDYSQCVKAEPGFFTKVDHQAWQKLVILLLDEMYIREDQVYNKHSGELIGFTNLGAFLRAASARRRCHSQVSDDLHGQRLVFSPQVSTCPW